MQRSIRGRQRLTNHIREVVLPEQHIAEVEIQDDEGAREDAHPDRRVGALPSPPPHPRPPVRPAGGGRRRKESVRPRVEVEWLEPAAAEVRAGLALERPRRGGSARITRRWGRATAE